MNIVLQPIIPVKCRYSCYLIMKHFKKFKNVIEKVGLNEYKFKPAITLSFKLFLDLFLMLILRLFTVTIIGIYLVCPFTVKKIFFFLFKGRNHPNYPLFYGRHNSISFSGWYFCSLASTLLSLMCLLLYITSWSISIWMFLSLFYDSMLQEFFISKFFYLLLLLVSR